LRGSKVSALEGGIRVPAAIWWKGVIEDSKSDQFFFVQDLLPTLLAAANIETEGMEKLDGKNKWDNLISNTVIAPENAFVGARVIADERALFDGQWKLYSSKPQLIPVSASYSLYNILDDPYETVDLSEEEPEVFEKMKKTLSSIEERDVVGDMNPAHAYLHGDDRQGGESLASPWLEGNYELNPPPNAINTFFITLWILTMAFKEYLTILVLLILAPLIYFKFFRSK
jgi:hypothetical protein